MSRRAKPHAQRHGKNHAREAHTHQLGAGRRWLDVVRDWPDLETGAEPDGAPCPLPGPGAGGNGKLKGEAA